MASPLRVTIKTETERLLYQRLTDEAAERKKIDSLVYELKKHIQELQEELKKAKEHNAVLAAKRLPEKETHSDCVQYETDEEDLARETKWVRQKSRKKRKLNLSPSPLKPEEPTTSKNATKSASVKKDPQPPPVIVEHIEDYQKFYDFLLTRLVSDSFLIKMRNGGSVKINATNEESYRALTSLLLEKNCSWYSYENKQDRPIRVMAINLPFSCTPDRIVEDLSSKGFKINDAVNKLSWRNKQPLNMFMLSFCKDEDINKIYTIKSILGCKVDIKPLRTSKLVPQCKKCQAYGHTQTYCRREPRCVKCTGKHLTKDCTKPAEAKPKCVHCGEPHPANYRGCVVAKELQQIKNKKTKSKVNANKPSASNVTEKPLSSQPVTKNLTFAQMTKGTKPQIQTLQQPHLIKTAPNLDEKLNCILNFLTSFDERLKKLEQNTRAISKQQ